MVSLLLTASLAAAAPAETPAELAQRIAGGEASSRAKLEKVHRWVVSNIRYDHQGLASGRAIREPQACLEQRRGVCQAISALYREMAQAVGVPVEEVFGVARGMNWAGGEPVHIIEGHSWNRVRLDGRLLWIDATHSLHEGASRSGDGAFLVEPMQMQFTHSADEDRLPGEPGLSREEMLAGPLVNHGAAHPLGISLPAGPPGQSVQGWMELEVGNATGAEMIAKARPLGDRALESDGETLVLRSEGKSRVLFSPRRAGWHHFIVFARPKGAAGGYTSVAEFALQVRPAAQPRTFPVLYGAFHSRQIELLDGFSGEAPASQDFSIALRAPDAGPYVLLPMTGGSVLVSEIKKLTKGRDGSWQFKGRLSPGTWALGVETSARRYSTLAAYQIVD